MADANVSLAISPCLYAFLPGSANIPPANTHQMKSDILMSTTDLSHPPKTELFLEALLNRMSNLRKGGAFVKTCRVKHASEMTGMAPRTTE